MAKFTITIDVCEDVLRQHNKTSDLEQAVLGELGWVAESGISVESTQPYEEPIEGALELKNEGGTDYILKPEHQSCWIEIHPPVESQYKTAVVYQIVRQEDGISVYGYAEQGDALTDSLIETWVTYSEAEYTVQGDTND